MYMCVNSQSKFHSGNSSGTYFGNLRILTKEYLFNQIWGSDSFSEQQTLTVHIKRLRQKIEDDPKNPKHIQTVWGVGYKYESI